MYENDTLYGIAGWVFIALGEALAVTLAILCKFPWWGYVLIIIGVFFVLLLYRPIFEIGFCLPALAIIGLLLYDAFSKDFSIPAVWIVLMLVWEALFLAYMIFFSALRETIDEKRMGMWQ